MEFFHVSIHSSITKHKSYDQLKTLSFTNFQKVENVLSSAEQSILAFLGMFGIFFNRCMQCNSGTLR